MNFFTLCLFSFTLIYYPMLYHTYRPRTIAELDNSSVKEIISSLLATKKLPHAFLFIGQKGTGKTSTARIIAKTINCLNNVFAEKSTSTEPCNTCQNCTSIDTGSSPDVTEMDAASHRGIDEVRQLIKDAMFAPIQNRYRVFIIDEAHMITNDAFNALLKTIEEPPKHTIFILATTNEEKVPKTITSRCVKVNFGRAQSEDVMHMLKRILTNEKVTIEPTALELIIRHSESSFRDATKLLEEIIIQKRFTLEAVQQYLGVNTTDEVLTLIQTKTLKECLLWSETFLQKGGSVKHMLEALLDALREYLLIQNNVKSTGKTSPFTTGQIIQGMRIFNEGYQLLRSTPIEALPLEISIVEFYNVVHRK